MRALFVVAVVLAAACDGVAPLEPLPDAGPPPDPEPVQGTWRRDDGARLTFLSFAVDGGGRVSVTRMAGANLERWEQTLGAYSVNGRMVTITPSQSTCAGAGPLTLTVKIDGDTMSVDDGEAETVFSRIGLTEIPGTDAHIETGCFAPDGSFVPQQVRPI